MPKTIQFQSRVDKDGVLDIHMPLGLAADAEVVVTIRPVATGASPRITDHSEWRRFVEETYGSCAGLGLERPPQGIFEQREAIE